LAEGERAGALGCFLSGAGPTLLALVTGDGGEVGPRMVHRWQEAAGVSARAQYYPIDREGLRVELG